MSILSALFDNKVYSFEQAFGVKDITSDEMKKAIRSWFALYFEDEAPKEGDDCQRLPVVVVNKITKTVFSEYEASIQGEGSKAQFMTELLESIHNVRKLAMQQALVGGECFIKPILSGKAFDFSVIRRDCFIPLARDITGRITSIGTAEFTTEGSKYYTLMERRTVTGGTLTIESKLYCAESRNTIGTPIRLDALEKYAALQPVVTLPGIGNLGIIQLKTPMMNCVDGSQDGVAIYASAVGIIKNINRNERLLCDEFELGQSRVIASADFIRQDERGNKALDAKLFTAVDDNPKDVGITIFSPALREASYLARKQEYLRNIESQIGLKRGILSEVEAAERTATEITSSAGDYNLTIQDFQQMWEDAVRELLVTCDRLGQQYKLCDATKFDTESIIVDWGDGVLFDRTRTWAEYQAMVASGMMKPEIALAWYFNLPHETPEDIAKIREQYMPEMEQLAGDA